LSGGERNRLLVARLLTRPANVLILDEPTNDLDLETLELLEAQLVEWSGTLLLVSHDRAFLENIVTSTWAFEGDGQVVESVGGYEDWVRQRDAARLTQNAAAAAPSRGVQKVESKGSARRDAQGEPSAARPVKLSNRERRELEQMPAQIAVLESEQRALHARVAGPEFYKEGADAIAAVLARIQAIERELLTLYERWDALESRR
jgi:ATP-binding cassette subfamily F protein uup